MKRFLVVLLCSLCASVAFAQKEKDDSVEVSGRIVDSFTREVIDSVWMEFYLPDSTTLVDTLMYLGQHKQKMGVWGEWEVDEFSHKLPSFGKYLIKCTKRGYKPLWQPLNIPRKKYNKKVKEWPMEDLLLSRSYYMDETLDEVTVTATRIKMFQNGDTVVFNADAFQLSEGSMLDELIRQLPGVELKDGGQIYINGNKCDELLVNGKNFFKGDAKVALENLPAYTVQNVKAYQKAADDAYLDKHHEQNKKKDPWVLDVGLKREYNKGWIANAEAGYGTDKRYLGRMFVTRYTDHSRITVYGNANNISDMSKPGSEEGWRQEYTPQGQIDVVNGGIDFHVDGKKTGTEFDTSVHGGRTVTDSQSEQSSTTFLSGGDVFGRNRSQNTSTAGNLNWDAFLRAKKKNYFSMVWATLGYSTSHSHGLNQTATLKADPMDSHRGATLDTLYAQAGSARLDSILTNKSYTLSKGNNKNTSASVEWHQSTVSPLNGERVALTLKQDFDDTKSNSYSHYDLRQGDNIDFRNKYTRQPSRSYNTSVDVEHGLFEVKKIDVSIDYTYDYGYSRGRRNLYRLDQLDGWGVNGGQSLGMLPSTTDSLAMAIDAQNSYYTINRNQKHTLALNVVSGGDWGFFYVNVPYVRRHDNIRDTRNGGHKTLTRCFDLWNPTVAFKYHKVEGYYSFSQSAPSMSYLLNVTDDSNPLSISYGNEHLGKTYQNSGQLRFTQNNMEKQSTYGLRASFHQGTQTGNAMTYDRETGVYTYQPRNVKGNWGSTVEYEMTQPLDKKKHLTLENELNAGYQRSVDWALEQGEEDATTSKVHNYTLNEVLQLGYKIKDYSVSLNASADYTHQTSSQESFTTTNTIDYNYGISSSLKFKFGMEFATDLTMHSRRGYEDHSMNDNNLVWNASLAMSFLKTKALMVKVIGHDILQQLSNVRRTVNAQGRTETWYNTQPAYGLITLSYKFTKRPKNDKSKKEKTQDSVTVTMGG